MKTAPILVLATILVMLFAGALGAQEPQQPGQPLYFPKGEYKEHPSDTAPDTDPYWREYQQQQQQRIQQGKPAENPYEDPKETIYESTTRYEISDDNQKKPAKPPARWGQ